MHWRVTTVANGNERRIFDVDAESAADAATWVQSQGHTVETISPVTTTHADAITALASAASVQAIEYAKKPNRRSNKRAKSTNPLGVTALLLGVFTALFSWIPAFGFLALPFAAIGLAFALAGVLIGILL